MTAPAPGLFLELTTELLASGRQVRFRAAGASMHPTIRNGEVVIVEPLAPAALKPGDICLYRTDRGLMMHRLVRISETAFLMRGDPRRFPEEPVSSRQILGKAVVVERSGERIALTGWRAVLTRRLYAAASRMRHLAV